MIVMNVKIEYIKEGRIIEMHTLDRIDEFEYPKIARQHMNDAIMKYTDCDVKFTTHFINARDIKQMTMQKYYESLI